MKRAIFASLLALTLGTASSLQAQTYTYDPVNQQFVPTNGYQTTQPNIVQAVASQVLPQYFGTSGTIQSSSYYPYSNNGYYNNGYYNSSYYNGYNNGYYSSPYGYNNGYGIYNTSPYSNVGVYGNSRGGFGRRR